MPHFNKHAKTKEGYLIAIEEELNLSENLPRQFYRLDIESALELYEWTLTSGRVGFLDKCKELNLSTEGIFNNG